MPVATSDISTLRTATTVQDDTENNESDDRDYFDDRENKLSLAVFEIRLATPVDRTGVVHSQPRTPNMLIAMMSAKKIATQASLLMLPLLQNSMVRVAATISRGRTTSHCMA